MLIFDKIPIDKEKVASCVQLLRDGDLTQVNYLTDAHMGLAACIAGKFAKRNPDIEDEIYSSVQEILFSKLLDIGKRPVLRDNDISPYLNKHISFSLRKLIEKIRLAQSREITIAEPVCFNNAVYNLVLEEIRTSDVFTAKEKEYIGLLFDGNTSKELVDKLGVSRQRLSIVRRSLAEKLKEFI
jgi:hypothetical protein